MPGFLFVVIVAYLLLLPNVDLGLNMQWHDNHRLAQAALLVLTALLFFIDSILLRHDPETNRAWRFLPRYARTALIAVFLLGAISCILAPLPRWAFLEWSLMLLLVILGLAVAKIRFVWKGRFDRLMLFALTLVVAAYLVKVATGYTASVVHGFPLHVWALFEGFSNPRFFGHFQGMTLPLMVLPAMLWAKTPGARIGWSLLPIFWWMLAIASGTRGTWFAMLMACITMFLVIGRPGYRWLAWQAGTFCVGLVAYGIFFVIIPQSTGVHAELINRLPDITNPSNRGYLWSRSLEFILAHPLWGIGPMHFAYYSNPIAAHPHMSLLQWAVEWGTPSALILMALTLWCCLVYVAGVRKLGATGNRDDFTLQLALLAALTAAAAQSMVDGVIVMPYSQILLVVLCGWAFSLHCSGIPPNTEPVRLNYKDRWLRPMIPLMATTIFIWSVCPEILNVVEREESYQARHPGKTLLPRFWSQGWIYD